MCLGLARITDGRPAIVAVSQRRLYRDLAPSANGGAGHRSWKRRIAKVCAKAAAVYTIAHCV
jgi:hypothetical protein